MSNLKNTQNLQEMHPNDLHFRRVMNYYDKGTPSTKKQVAIVVTGNKNANRSNVMDSLGDMDYNEILDTEKLLKLKDESVALNEGLGSAISKIRNLAIKVASQKVDSAQNHLKLDKIRKDKPNGKAAMTQAQMALTSQGNLDEDLKSIINKLAVKVGTSSSYGAILSGLLSAGSWFSYLESTFMRWYYSEIQNLAEPEVFRVMQDLYGAKSVEGSMWGKFGMYAFFIFFVIALISLAVARLSKDNLKTEEEIPGGLAKGMTLPDIANHHKVDIDELMKELQLGIKTELEHTSDRKVAEEIALDHLYEDPKYYTNLTAMEKGNLKAEASNPAERIQNLNNRIAKLRGDMARASTDNQKNILQARLKNALQTLSNIRKDLGVKKEVVSEASLVFRINEPAVEKFLKKYPRVNQIMTTLVGKNKDIMRGYKAFLKLKDNNEDYLGGRAEVTSSPTFGTKTFYKYDWNGVGGWAEVYQYIYNQKNESVNEAWDAKNGKVMFNGKAVGEYDFDTDSDSFWVMDLEKGKGQKSFDTKQQMIDYFKKHKKNESINEAGPCWKGYKQIGMKSKDGREVPNCVPESLDLNESKFSEIDIMAKEAGSFSKFVKSFYKEYPELPKDRDSMKWLEGLYKSSIDESYVDSDGLERAALALPQTKEEDTVNEDCGCNRSTLTEGVAKEILNQLGGNRFIAMTGAKNLIDGGKYLALKLPRAKDSINYVKITLTSMDLYDIEFGRIRANQYKVVKKVDGVYNDQLQSIFTKVTGLYTRL